VTDLDRWGDRLMLGSFYSKETEQSISAAFGDGFTRALAELPVGVWHGPMESAYGLHLVRVTERTDSRIPEWTEVRERVTTDMEYETRRGSRCSRRSRSISYHIVSYRIVFDADVKALMETDSK